jgi:5'-methylthioadenosine phosphorylase
MVGRIGIIGGSGLGEALGALGTGESHEIDTPFGKPSAPIVTTEVDGVPVALLARHGPGHVFNPSAVPYRANIWALKSLGVTHVIASAACGSLREEIAPRDLIVIDQVVDKTFRRPNTFFEELAVHVEIANPFCPGVRGALLGAARKVDTNVHRGGTYVCMEGPQFSTRAESEIHRSWGAHLIGMTLMPEAKLAREAELCYAAVTLATDYDCWRPAHEDVSKLELLKEIISNLEVATRNALGLIRNALPTIASGKLPTCSCQSALELGIWTDKSRIPEAARKRLDPLIGKYLR